MVELPSAVWDRIVDHARADYPDECCGLLTRSSDGDLQVHACENIQDKLHARDPEAHPRTARTAFRMDDLAVHRLLTDTEKDSGRLLGFYHSHIDCEAYFSEEDRTAAMFLGEPTYPDVLHVVISVCDGELKGQKGFRWDVEARDFVEVPVGIVV